jgi:hypothetical protein
MEKKLVNLTPHEIKIVGQDGEVITTIPPSGQVARVRTKQAVVEYVNDIPIVKTTFGDVEGLPEPRENIVYIVSSIVAQAVPHREDVIAPDTSPQGVVRDEKGQIIGVKRFQRW